MGESAKILSGVWVVLLFDLPTSVTGQSITVPPQNATGKIRGTVEFHCKVEFGKLRTMSWDFNNNTVYIYQYGQEDYPNGDKKYNVTKKGNNFIITINNLDFSDGGLFTCVIESVMETAVLIVLDIPKFHRPLDTPQSGMVMHPCEAWFGGPAIQSISPNHYPDMMIFFNKVRYAAVILHPPKHQRNNHQIIGTVLIPQKAIKNGTLLKCEIRTRSPIFVVASKKIINIGFMDRIIPTTSENLPLVTDNLPLVTENVMHLSKSHTEHWKIIAGLAVSFSFILAVLLALQFYTRHSKKKQKEHVYFPISKTTGRRELAQHEDEHATTDSNGNADHTNQRVDEELGATAEPSDLAMDFGPEYPLQQPNMVAMNQAISSNLVNEIIFDSIKDIEDTSINTGATGFSEVVPFRRFDGGKPEPDLIRQFRITTELIGISQLRVHIQMLGYTSRYSSLPQEDHVIWLKDAVIYFKPNRLFIRSDNNKICQGKETEVNYKDDQTPPPEDCKMDPAQNIKEISIVLDRVAYLTHQLQEEPDSYAIKLRKAFLARGLIEAVEKAIDWCYPKK